MNSAKVAVIIRTKDRELLLERSLNSVLSQTYRDFIAVVVNDGGSGSNVDKLIKKLDDKRIKAVHNEESLGRWPAANQGIKSVKSDYIVLLDDDDSWKPEFLKTSVDYLTNNKSNGVATSSLRVKEDVQGGKIIKIHEAPYYTYDGLPILAYKLFQENLVPTNAFLFRRSAYDTVGGYNELMQVSADWEFNRRFVEDFDIDTIPDQLAVIHHRFSAGASSSLSNTVIAGRLTHKQTEIRQLNNSFRNDIKSGAHKGILENELRYQLKNQQKMQQDIDIIKKQLNQLVLTNNQVKELWPRAYSKLKRTIPKTIKARLK